VKNRKVSAKQKKRQAVPPTVLGVLSPSGLTIEVPRCLYCGRHHLHGTTAAETRASHRVRVADCCGKVYCVALVHRDELPAVTLQRRSYKRRAS
jgi:hypothetical protein